ncbi:hypothetical protein [Zoogloea sp.]|uniref:hypothetical protein n=1 Tax=Zoogloea sp. TaxID=49181 RepID=UPI0025F25626|nr:hypothetical protein [Zoogloea sp.]
MFAQFTVLLDDREAMQAKFADCKFRPRFITPSPQRTARLQASAARIALISKETAKRVMSLPMGPDLTVESQKTVTLLLA